MLNFNAFDRFYSSSLYWNDSKIALKRLTSIATSILLLLGNPTLIKLLFIGKRLFEKFFSPKIRQNSVRILFSSLLVPLSLKPWFADPSHSSVTPITGIAHCSITITSRRSLFTKFLYSLSHHWLEKWYKIDRHLPLIFLSPLLRNRTMLWKRHLSLESIFSLLNAQAPQVEYYLTSAFNVGFLSNPC